MGGHFHTNRGGTLLWAPPGIVGGLQRHAICSAGFCVGSYSLQERDFSTQTGEKWPLIQTSSWQPGRSRSGASHALLRALHAGHLTAVASVSMMLEYEAVLMRPEQRQATGMSAQDVQDFLDELAALLIPVTSWFLWRPRLRDPDDEMVLDAAINGGAEAIVTFNVKDFLPGTSAFNLRILTPAEALLELRRS